MAAVKRLRQAAEPGYSYCSDSSTSRREARRAGWIAASTPSERGEDQQHDQRADRIGEREAFVLQRLGDQRREDQPEDHAEDRADQRRDHRLVADHRPHLAARHPDRPQHPQLPRAFVDRERQRVGDPEQRDHDRQREQRVEEVDELVDLFFAAFLQFLLVEDFGDREGRFDALGEQRLDLGRVGTRLRPRRSRPCPGSGRSRAPSPPG